MIDRITKNEERLDNINLSIRNLEDALNAFKSNKKDIVQLKKYYGSKSWFKDKENFEKGSIPKVKAGVLSEDSVWNTLDDIDELIKDMQKVIDEYK